MVDTMNDAPDLAAITENQRQTWSDGDFSMVAGLVNFVSEELVESLRILPGERVLDVACGSGNATLAAARRAWGNAVGCDFVPALLERGRERAAAERLDVEFVEADAQELSFGDGEFDVAVSVFGAMFAPDQERTAAELLRVVKPGGRIGMANWTPEGLGAFFMTIAKHVGGPPPGTVPPVLWGTEEHLRELFGDGVSELRLERRRSRQGFRSIDHYFDFFRAYFGPVKAAFEKAGPEGEAALEADLRQVLAEQNTSDDERLVLELEYLRVIATRA
jgi:ubiquinone/menaquinone biosynthesis C-methylase UbiE